MAEQVDLLDIAVERAALIARLEAQRDEAQDEGNRRADNGLSGWGYQLGRTSGLTTAIEALREGKNAPCA